MNEKLTKLVLLFLLFLLQSCSGGKIGNFLESSFENIDLIEEDSKDNNIFNNKKNNISQNQSLKKVIYKENNQKKKLIEKNKLVKKNRVIDKDNYQKKGNSRDDEKILIEKITKSEDIAPNKKESYKFESNKKKKIFKPQSYKITVILNEVDPTSPLEKFSNVLRNSNLNFEIENIQRYQSNKKLNKNNEY